MISQKLNIISEIAIKHSYFPQNLLPPKELKFYFAKDVDKRVYHIQEIDSGVIIYNKKSDTDTAHEPQLIFLSFQQIDFPNFTDLNFQAGYIHYYPSESGSSQLLPLHNKNFSFPLSLSEKEDLSQVSLRLADGNQISLNINQASKEEGYQIDLNDFASTYYELEFSFHKQKAISYAFIAASLPLGDYPFAALSLLPGKANAGINYLQLEFESRATYWRYLFPKIIESDWENYLIEPLRTDSYQIDFQKVSQAIALANNTYAYAYISSKPIALVEKPSYKITLITPNFPEGLQLPYAAPRLLLPLEDNKSTTNFCSNIYVNI